MTTKMISDKQVGYIKSLMESRVNGKMYVQTQIQDKPLDTISSFLASNIIGVLINEPKTTKMAAASGPKNFVTEVGIYKGADGNLYKVQESKWNPGKFYSKKLVVTAKGSASFEYDPTGMKKISPESKVSLAEAIAFGLQFGVCCRCGRDLTAASSVSAGIGPVCSKKFG